MNQKQKKLLCSLIGSALLLSTAGVASAEETFNLDEYVVTANRMPVKMTEVAANVTVISHEEIEKSGATNVSDILRKNDVNMGANSFSAHPVLNGDDRVLILVDGRKMNFAHLMVSGNDHVMNIDTLSVKNIERIEVVRGPGSSLYGSDAAGGVINIITRKGETKSASVISSEFGSWGSRRNSFTTEGNTNGISYLLTAEQKKRDSFTYRDAETNQSKTFAATQLDQDLVTLRLDKELDKGSSLSLQLEHMTDKSGFGNNINSGSAYYPNAYQDITDNNVALTYHWSQDTGTENFFRVYQNASSGTLYNSLVKTGDRPYTFDLHANGAEWQQGWKISDKQTLVGGANWREEHLDDKDTVDKGVSTKSLFLESRWQLPSKWTLSAGTRYDDQSISGTNFTSHLSANREINENTNVYASWGQFVRNPTVAQLFSNTSNWSGNPALKPETGSTTTIGLNTKLGDGTKLQASIYSSRLQDALEWTSPWPNPGPGTYVNLNREKRQGLDLNLTRTLSPQWNVSAGYSYAQVKKQASGTSDYKDDINNSQPNGYRLGVQYDQDKWNAGLTMLSATGRSLDGFTSKSYVTIDMVANYQVNPTTRIYAKGYNLTNKAYELSHVWGLYPMPERNFSIGIEHRM